jgi:hypothetical protein
VIFHWTFDSPPGRRLIGPGSTTTVIGSNRSAEPDAVPAMATFLFAFDVISSALFGLPGW